MSHEWGFPLATQKEGSRKDASKIKGNRDNRKDAFHHCLLLNRMIRRPAKIIIALNICPIVKNLMIYPI